MESIFRYVIKVGQTIDITKYSSSIKVKYLYELKYN